MPPYKFIAEKPLRIRYGYGMEKTLKQGDEIEEIDHERLTACVSTGDLVDIAPPQDEKAPESATVSASEPDAVLVEDSKRWEPGTQDVITTPEDDPTATVIVTDPPPPPDEMIEGEGDSDDEGTGTSKGKKKKKKGKR